MRTLGVSYLLSAEQITQCDRLSSGCRGGWTETAYHYVQNTGGLELEADYPYTSYYGITGSCHSDSKKYKVTVTGFKTLTLVDRVLPSLVSSLVLNLFLLFFFIL